jgi:hypothetical protein
MFDHTEQRGLTFLLAGPKLFKQQAPSEVDHVDSKASMQWICILDKVNFSNFLRSCNVVRLACVLSTSFVIAYFRWQSIDKLHLCSQERMEVISCFCSCDKLDSAQEEHQSLVAEVESIKSILLGSFD